MNETPKKYEGDKSPKKTITGADIEMQLQRDSILEKPYSGEGGLQNVEQVLQQCNVPADMAQKFASVGGRDKLHLLRMLRRSEAERNFSLAYIRHRDDIFGEDQESAQSVRKVINSEGADTMMFWTFSPYLFKALIEKGISERDAIKKTLSWSKDGVSAITESNKGYGEEQRDWNKLHLKGLKKYETHGGGYILSKDSNHVSHKYTEQEAKHIADLLIAENDEK
jgi:hypothetical protein